MGRLRIKKRTKETRLAVKKLRRDGCNEIWRYHFGRSGFGLNEGATCFDCLQYIGCPGTGVPEECMDGLWLESSRKI
jgi:hypothetical protein